MYVIFCLVVCARVMDNGIANLNSVQLNQVSKIIQCSG